MEKEISVVIPAYNEQYRLGKTIREVHKFLKTQKWAFEIICVDDGSTDRTAKIILDAMVNYKTVRIVSYKNNIGKGYAIRQGALEAKYESILLLDADHSVDINKLFWLDKRYWLGDIESLFIYGQRIQEVPQPLYRIFVGKVWKILVFLLTGIYADTQCPFKYIHIEKEFFKELTIDGFAFDVEIFYKLKKMGIDGCSVDVPYYNSEDSRVTFKKTYQMFIDLVKIKWGSKKSS